MASEASCISLRPEFQENSVSPIPMMAALSLMPLVSAGMMVLHHWMLLLFPVHDFPFLEVEDLLVGIPQLPEDGAGVLALEWAGTSSARGFRKAYYRGVAPELAEAGCLHVRQETKFADVGGHR